MFHLAILQAEQDGKLVAVERGPGVENDEKVNEW